MKIIGTYSYIYMQTTFKSLATAYAHNHIRTLYLGRKSLASKFTGRYSPTLRYFLVFYPVFGDRKASDCIVIFPLTCDFKRSCLCFVDMFVLLIDGWMNCHYSSWLLLL